MTESQRVPSPCLGICRMDPAQDYCLGCLRTLQEIATWSQMDDRQRQAVLDQLPRRVEQGRP